MRVVRVDERVAAGVALVAGIAAAFSPASPVGAQPYDAILLVLAAGFVTWAGSSAAWWAGAVAAGVGALVAFDPVVAVVGGVAAFGALVLGTQRRDQTLTRAVIAGVAVNVLCRSEMDGFTGASAVIGVGLSLLLVVNGVLRRRKTVRRRAMLGMLGAAGLAVVASLGAAVPALAARGNVNEGRVLVEAGIEQLSSGEYVEAATSFAEAEAVFGASAAAMSKPWAQPARFVPVVAQNRRAVDEVAAAAERASAELANASLFINPDDLRVRDGRFDLDVFAEITEPISAANDALLDLRATIDDVDSPWLSSVISSRLDVAAEQFDDNADTLDTAVEALRLAPGLLGGDGARRYFIAFTTPAEARGLGGFMGNYAVVTADDGELTLSEFGRTSDLNSTVSTDDGRRRLDPPAEWDARWGRFGFTSGPDGTTGDVPWSNITISPQFPSTAEVIAELFPQSGGSAVDGVFAMDPFVLEAFVGFASGVEIDVDGETLRLTGSNTADFLLYDQYLLEDAEQRTDLLEVVAEAVVEELLAGALPGPTVLASELGPLTDAGRLVGWSTDTDEQPFFERIGLDGGLPSTQGGDGFSLVLNNAGANKLDAFLTRDLSYRAETDPVTGSVVGTIEAALTNSAPTSGLPSGVIDNYVGDPVGTNRTLLTMYTALPVYSMTFDGAPVEFEPGVEAGWNTASAYVLLPPGSTSTLAVDVAGVVGELPYRLLVGAQPLVDTPTLDVRVTDPGNRELIEDSGIDLDGWRLLSTELLDGGDATGD